MNTRFKPKVEFTKDRIRSRLSVVRKQWDRKRKGLQVSRSVSQSIPVSLLEKHSQTIAEELADAEPESSSSVHFKDMNQAEMTVEEIAELLISWGVHPKKINRYRRALLGNKGYASLFHLYAGVPAKMTFLKQLSSKDED